jgi:hypothetical protein
MADFGRSLGDNFIQFLPSAIFVNTRALQNMFALLSLRFCLLIFSFFQNNSLADLPDSVFDSAKVTLKILFVFQLLCLFLLSLLIYLKNLVDESRFSSNTIMKSRRVTFLVMCQLAANSSLSSCPETNYFRNLNKNKLSIVKRAVISGFSELEYL